MKKKVPRPPPTPTSHNTSATNLSGDGMANPRPHMKPHDTASNRFDPEASSQPRESKGRMYYCFNVYTYTASCVHGRETSSPSPGKKKKATLTHTTTACHACLQPNPWLDCCLPEEWIIRLSLLLRGSFDGRCRTAVTYASTGLVHDKSLSIHALIPLRALGRLSQEALATPPLGA